MFMNLKRLAVSVLLTATTQVNESENMHEDFVDILKAVPNIVVEARYASADNFAGTVITGYNASKVIVSRPVAVALAAVQTELMRDGLSLKIYDGYRPQRAVDHFVRWIADTNDQKNKAQYYPDVEKGDLVTLGYIAEKSGHSRGGSVDLTMVRKDSDGAWVDVEMGSAWDLFDVISHADASGISAEAVANRKFLADVMIRYGFRPYSEEWWHFTLDPEPYPNTYFDFPID